MKKWISLLLTLVLACAFLTAASARDEHVQITYRGGIYLLDTVDLDAELIGVEDKNVTSLSVPQVVPFGGAGYVVDGIETNACRGLKKLRKVFIGKNVDEIEKGAFQDCVNLETVSGMAGVEEIGAHAFSGCVSLTAVTLPVRLREIDANAFNGCRRLKTITIRTKLLTKNNVGRNAFKGVYARPTVVCPKGLADTYKAILSKKGMPEKAKYQ